VAFIGIGGSGKNRAVKASGTYSDYLGSRWFGGMGRQDLRSSQQAAHSGLL
jgi:hypothetical protein